MVIPQPFVDRALDTFPPVGISVLGSFRLTLAGNPALIVTESKSEQFILCLVLAKQHRLPRAHLLERIWPQSDLALAGQALNSLSHQLNKLTSRFLNGNGIIVHETGYYRLNLCSGVWVDIDHFAAWSEMGKRLLSNGEVSVGVNYCEQALALYQGDLYGDSSIQAVIERERLRTIYLDVLARLASHYYTHHEPEKALLYIQRLATHDPCREDAHRMAMRCYMHLNQRAQALRQYGICCQALTIEFDVKPEPATVALFDQIRLDPASI